MQIRQLVQNIEEIQDFAHTKKVIGFVDNYPTC